MIYDEKISFRSIIIIWLLSFSQNIKVQKGSYCKGISGKSADSGSGSGTFTRFYDTCVINGITYKNVALEYGANMAIYRETKIEQKNIVSNVKKFLNTKLEKSDVSVLKPGITLEYEKNAEIINVPFIGNKWPDEGASRSDTEEVTKDRFYIEDIYPIETDKINKK